MYYYYCYTCRIQHIAAAEYSAKKGQSSMWQNRQTTVSWLSSNSRPSLALVLDLRAGHGFWSIAQLIVLSACTGWDLIHSIGVQRCWVSKLAHFAGPIARNTPIAFTSHVGPTLFECHRIGR